MHMMCTLFIGLSIHTLQAQQTIPAKMLTIQGRAFPSAPNFHRLDTAKYNDLPPTVKKLYTHPTGLFTSFKSNTSKLAITWETIDAELGNNSTPIMSVGLMYMLRKTTTGDLPAWHVQTCTMLKVPTP